MNVNLFGNRVPVDVIRLRRQSHWVGLGLSPICLMSSEEEGSLDIDTQGRKGHVKVKTEIGVMDYKPRNDKDFWKPLEVGRGKEEHLEGSWLADILILDF